MLFQCTNCHKDLNIPDEKLPDSPRFKIRCPHCKEQVVLERGQAYASTSGAAGADFTITRQPEQTGPQGSGEDEPEIFPPGAKVAFFFIEDTAWQEAAESFFQDMGYHQSGAGDPVEAVLKLRLNDYHVLLLEDAPENLRILDEIAIWNGLKRRNINVVLLGDQAGSMNPHMAFRKGVNTYLNVNDVDRAGELLGNALRGYEEHYRTLLEAQKALE